MSQAERIYLHLYRHIHEQGFPPTSDEIATSCRMSLNKVERNLKRLENQRKIVRLAGKPRSIRLAEIEHDWHVEEQVYHYVMDYSYQWGRLPNLSQVAQGCHLRIETVSDHLRQLVTSGRLNAYDDNVAIQSA